MKKIASHVPVNKYATTFLTRRWDFREFAHILFGIHGIIKLVEIPGGKKLLNTRIYTFVWKHFNGCMWKVGERNGCWQLIFYSAMTYFSILVEHFHVEHSIFSLWTLWISELSWKWMNLWRSSEMSAIFHIHTLETDVTKNF